MIRYVLAALTALALSVFIGFFAVKLLKKYGLKQTVSKYVGEHREKNGTPTMGGVIFVLPAIAVSLLYFKGKALLSLVSLAVFFAYALVGFFDDFIKVKFRRNEGLSPMQKIVFQLAIAVVFSVFTYKTGLTEQYIPYTKIKTDLGFFIIPLGVFVLTASTNCVNLTDGLDGLAGTVSAICLLFLSAVVLLQAETIKGGGAAVEEYRNLSLTSVAAAFSIVGFLVFNVNKASVFMGDTGSLALGGLIGSAFTLTGNVFSIPVIGITFVLSGVSVIVQVLHYKRTKKRVFKMAPFHHHLQHSGYSESKITYIYKVLTVAAGLSLLICYLGDF